MSNREERAYYDGLHAIAFFDTDEPHWIAAWKDDWRRRGGGYQLMEPYERLAAFRYFLNCATVNIGIPDWKKELTLRTFRNRAFGARDYQIAPESVGDY